MNRRVLMPIVASFASAFASQLAKQYLEQRRPEPDDGDGLQQRRPEPNGGDGLEQRRRERAEHRAARRNAS